MKKGDLAVYYDSKKNFNEIEEYEIAILAEELRYDIGVILDIDKTGDYKIFWLLCSEVSHYPKERFEYFCANYEKMLKRRVKFRNKEK